MEFIFVFPARGDGFPLSEEFDTILSVEVEISVE